jgi:hypothetical protein
MVLIRCLTVLSVLGMIFAAPVAASAAALRIVDDRGGHVVDYSLRIREIVRQGRQVKVAGRCDSACTLFLALPSPQLCVSQGARFGFHLPFGGRREDNQVAHAFMLANYPGWVRSWIDQNGGLTSRLIVMDYSYARRFIGVCEA